MPIFGTNAVHCWVKFSGSGNVSSTAVGHNVSSAVDNGEGDYTINFTNNFANTNYCHLSGSDNTRNQLRVNCRVSQAVGSYRFETRGSNDNKNDPDNGMAAFVGDRA